MDIWTSAYGIVEPVPVLKGELSEGKTLSGAVTTILDLYKEAFQGPYAVESKLDEDYILPTKDLILTSNITVARIPVTREENQQGGLTVTIGRSLMN